MGRTKTTFDKARASAAGKAKKGKKHASTKIKERLKGSLEDLKADVEKVWIDCLSSEKIEDRKFAAKEISKYLYPTKTENKNDNNNFDHVVINTIQPDMSDVEQRKN